LTRPTNTACFFTCCDCRSSRFSRFWNRKKFKVFNDLARCRIELSQEENWQYCFGYIKYNLIVTTRCRYVRNRIFEPCCRRLFLPTQVRTLLSTTLSQRTFFFSPVNVVFSQPCFFCLITPFEASMEVIEFQLLFYYLNQRLQKKSL
jgi:hypothetical protein